MAHLIKCPVCENSVSSNASTCPHCGEKIRMNKCRSVKGGFISLLIFAAGVAITYFGTPNDRCTAATVIGVLIAIIALASVMVCFTTPERS